MSARVVPFGLTDDESRAVSAFAGGRMVSVSGDLDTLACLAEEPERPAVVVLGSAAGRGARGMVRAADPRVRVVDLASGDRVEDAVDRAAGPDAAEAQHALDTLLLGGDAVRPLVDAAAQAASVSGITFQEAGGGTPPWARSVPVRWREVVVGHLVLQAELTAEQRSALSDWAPLIASVARVREQHRALRRAALTDPLTGAWNRHYFDRYLTAALRRASGAGQSLSLMVFDIDSFKRFNDEHGHPAGDTILRATVRLLRSVIRPTDRVCRIGGDEFAVIFYEPLGPRRAGSAPADAHTLACRFQKQINEQRFPELGLHAPGGLAISGGLASFPADGRTAEELIDHADSLALRSKRQGKNQICIGPRSPEGGEC